MPRRYPRNRRHFRRSLRRVRRAIRRARTKAVVVNRGITPIAPRFITKLKYADEASLTSTTGIPAIQVWNLNSLFDPDRTGTGHQPYGYDQIKTLYDYYRVFAVSWRIDFVPNTAAEIPRLTVLPADESSLPSTTNRTLMMEMPRAITKEGHHGANKVSFRGRITLHKLRGQTSQQYRGDDDNRAQIGFSPAHVLGLYCVLASANNAGVTINGVLRITLVYHVEFYDSTLQSQS